MPTRTADAEWRGGLQGGTGTMAMASGAYEGQYSFSSRFEEGTGTNPEELIAAAHAGCFSMQFSALLEAAGHVPDRVSTTATVHLDKDGGGFTITRVHLSTKASVSGMDEDAFQTVAEEAKRTCPVSRVLAGADITMDAALV